MRWRIVITLWLTGLCAWAQTTDSLCIIEYNVQNLFHPEHDSLKNDWDFTPQGIYHWSFYHYHRKVAQISRVITNIAGFQAPAIVGLCEVENEQCMRSLQRKMYHYPFQYLFHEGPDQRGIDVGLLYDTTQLQAIHTRFYPLLLDSLSHTREILYAAFLDRSSQHIYHLILCHLPSQLGGTQATEWKRQKGKALIQQLVDSIALTTPQPRIIVMGDMNTAPRNDINGLSNQMMPYRRKDIGTHKYQGLWTCLDQVYLSPILQTTAKVQIYQADYLLEEDKKFLGHKPYATFKGRTFQKDGFSDHLPLWIRVKK